MRWIALIFIFFTQARPANASALADGGRLEEQLRLQLDRVFIKGEYVIDLQLKAVGEKSNQAHLPGLGFGALPLDADKGQIIGRYSNLFADILLIVDQSVSKERIKIAEDIIRRMLDGISLTERSSVKTRHQKLRRASEVKVLPPPAPKPEYLKSFVDQVEQNKDSVLKMSFAVWGAICSLVIIYGLTLRWTRSSQPVYSGLEPLIQPILQNVINSDHAASQSSESEETNALKTKVLLKEELYSKDQAFLEQVKDALVEAKSHASKVAKVLSRWVSLSDEKSRLAAIFLKNCDIQTVEAISSFLHPSDLEKIIKYEVENFDVFSEDNQKVLDLMRADLALQAAETASRDRPDPLDFAKNMTEDEIAALVRGEPLELVALVATQIPVRRMQKYYASLTPSDLNRLCTLISTMTSPSMQQFEATRQVLLKKAKVLDSALFNDKIRGQTLVQLLMVVASPKQLMESARTLFKVNKELYQATRPKIFLPGDIFFLNQQTLGMISRSVAPEILGAALSGLRCDLERLAKILPKGYGATFFDFASLSHEVHEQNDAWEKVNKVIRDLRSSGQLTDGEIQTARIAFDQTLEEFEEVFHAA